MKNEMISTVNGELLDVIKNIKEEKMSNQTAQVIINASSAIFKGLMVEVNQKRFVNKK